MKIDPAIVKIHAENVRAEVLPRATPSRLDPAVVQKIAEKVKVFQGMPPDQLGATLALSERVSFAAGEMVFKEGDIGSAFHILIAGEVVIEKNRGSQTMVLATLSAGECFGEMALVANHLRSASARVSDQAVTLRLDRETVDSHPPSAHIIYRNIARVLAQRLGASSELLTEMALRQDGAAPLGVDYEPD